MSERMSDEDFDRLLDKYIEPGAMAYKLREARKYCDQQITSEAIQAMPDPIDGVMDWPISESDKEYITAFILGYRVL